MTTLHIVFRPINCLFVSATLLLTLNTLAQEYTEAFSKSDSGVLLSDSTDSITSKDDAISGDLKNHLVGYWRSVKKSVFSDNYIYQAFSKTEYYDVISWIPYKVVDVNGNELIYAWTQDGGVLGEFNRKTKVTFLPDKKIMISYDRISEGNLYEKISEDQWIEEKKELDDDAIQQLREKIGETIQRLGY
jgi:hypothetical protein